MRLLHVPPGRNALSIKALTVKGASAFYGILEQNQFSLPHVDVERAKYFTESMRETEGELLTLRWAKALKNVAEKITVYITPNQLIAGRVGKFGRYGILYPEIDGDFYREVLADLEHRRQEPLPDLAGRHQGCYGRDCSLLGRQDLP